MKVFLKTEDEIELMRQANLLVGKTLGELATHIKPGVTTLQLDSSQHLYVGKRRRGAWRAQPGDGPQGGRHHLH